MDNMDTIRQTFFEECDDLLTGLEAGLLALKDGDRDRETVNVVFRAVHSVKGGAGAFQLQDLVRFAHTFESALEHLRAGRLVADAPTLGLMLRATDVLADLVGRAKAGGVAEEATPSLVAAELEALATRCAGPLETGTLDDLDFTPVMVDLADFDDLVDVAPLRQLRVTFTPAPALYAKANETARLLRELSRLGEATVTCDTSALPRLTDLDPEGAYLTWTVDLATRRTLAEVEDVFCFVEGDCALAIVEHRLDGPAKDVPPAADVPQVANVVPFTPHPAPAAPAERAAVVHPVSVRVDLDRVDALIDLVGELVITQAMLAQRVAAAGVPARSAVGVALDDLEQLTRSIQDSVMAIRAQPVRAVFSRMPRLVREVAAVTGKSVRLVTEGEATEVDRTVIERLSDPLTHIIRNAIDHGLETPERRLASGKAAEGTVRLSALHRSGRIVIEVADDGAGIDRPRVRAIAAERGLIAADAALSDEETDDLIFLAGFSTAATVSDISGRGVGMDIVKQSIQALGGRIGIVSEPGAGSTFTLSLPLTLAVLDGMVVTVAGQTLVVPLTAIVETLQPRRAAVHGFGDEARVIAIRDGIVPLVDVGRVLGYRRAPSDPMASIAVLVETEGGDRSALLVDAILGQRQVVIKSLETNYGPVFGIAAATILGDGRVALILDVDAVVAETRGARRAAAPLAATG